MKKTLVATAEALKDGDRLIVHVDGAELGVFRKDGMLRAYSNYCLHAGGPACEGLVIARIEERILEDKTSAGLFFSKDETHFVCPWHGYEYDLKTGECVADRRLKLRAYDVVESDGNIYIVS
jgi:nitrite reductase/ring-hydroxylating ferredoxin subunit